MESGMLRVLLALYAGFVVYWVASWLAGAVRDAPLSNQALTQPIAGHGSTALPLCTDLRHGVQGLRHGWFLTRSEGKWAVQPDATYRYSLDMCVLKRFTAQEARECLRSRPMLWTGDSLTRYQYMSLVFFLHTGAWPARRGGNEPAWNISSVCAEGHWHDWGRYYRDVPAKFDGMEWCDCFRSPSLDYIRENRYFYMPDEDVKVSMLFMYATTTVKAMIPRHFRVGQRHGLFYRDPVEYKNVTPEFVGTVAELVERVPYLQDTKLLIAGLYGSQAPPEEWAFGHALTARNGGAAFYKPQPVPRYRPPEQVAGLRAAVRAGWEIFDATWVTRSLVGLAEIHYDDGWVRTHKGNALFPARDGADGRGSDSEWDAWFVDSVHFLPFVYEELNTLLLNQLC